MKKHILLPSLSAAGGALCFLLRCVQLRTGFEPDTGLPVAGDPLGLLLPLLLAALAAAVIAAAWKLPDEKEDCPHGFGRQFAAEKPIFLVPTIAGIVLWGLSGAAQLVVYLRAKASGFYYTADIQLNAVTGILILLAAGGLLPAVAAARWDGDVRPKGEFLLLPVVTLVAYLALAYREMSVNASQQTYYPSLLALMALIVCLFRLSSFAFRCGKTRRFVVFSAAAVILCLTAAADPASLPVRLFFAGGAAIALGFQFLRLAALARNGD